MKTKIHPVKKLIEQGEHQQLDFKFEISDAAKIARTLVAFANTDGGRLLIGVKDNGVIRGVESDEEYFMIENAAQRYCQPEISFSSKEWVVDGKRVLEIKVPASSLYPHRAPDHKGNYRAYIRVGDENMLANGVLMKVWKKQKSNKNIKFVYSQPEKDLLTYLQKNEFATLSEVKKITHLSKFKSEQLLSDLILLNVIEMNLAKIPAVFCLKSPIPE